MIHALGVTKLSHDATFKLQGKQSELDFQKPLKQVNALPAEVVASLHVATPPAHAVHTLPFSLYPGKHFVTAVEVHVNAFAGQAVHNFPALLS